MAGPLRGTMSSMPALPCAHLTLVPGTVLVLFVVQVDAACTVLAVPAGRFLDGLRLAGDLMGFAGLERAEEPLEDLLPWSGNV